MIGTWNLNTDTKQKIFFEQGNFNLLYFHMFYKNRTISNNETNFYA